VTAQYGRQHGAINRFPKMVVHPRGQATLAFFRPAMRRHGDNRCATPGFGQIPDCRRRLEPVHLGHPDIHQDGGIVTVPHRFDRLLTIRDGIRLITHVTQYGHGQHAVHRTVVDKEKSAGGSNRRRARLLRNRVARRRRGFPRPHAAISQESTGVVVSRHAIEARPDNLFPRVKRETDIVQPAATTHVVHAALDRQPVHVLADGCQFRGTTPLYPAKIHLVRIRTDRPRHDEAMLNIRLPYPFGGDGKKLAELFSGGQEISLQRRNPGHVQGRHDECAIAELPAFQPQPAPSGQIVFAAEFGGLPDVILYHRGDRAELGADPWVRESLLEGFIAMAQAPVGAV
jgi:hypothetical protein